MYLTGGYIYGKSETYVGKDQDISSYYGIFGIALDYSKGGGNTSLAIGSLSAKSYGLTVYGSYVWDNYYADAYSGLGKIKEKTERRISIGSLAFTATASPEATRYLMGAEFGYNMKLY